MILALPEALDMTVQIWKLNFKLQSTITPGSIVKSQEDNEKPHKVCK